MAAGVEAIKPTEWISRHRVRWVILRTCIEERLVYRADFAMGTLFRFLPIVTQIFLWGAIFGVSAETGSSGEERRIAGYSYHDMVAYYLLAMLARAFSSMPGLASGVARDVRDGTVKKYLTQPIDMLGYLFWHRVAHKLVYYAVAAGPFALVFWLCRDFFPGWPDGWRIAAFVASLLMGFLMGFLLEALIGMISFWFLEVSSLLFIYMMINYFLSGHMLPLDLLPDWVTMVVDYLPFKYLAYHPPAILLGRYSEDQLLREMLIEAGWIVGLLLLNRIAFARGVRRYGAFGG
ncbi:MAG: ABC transporter permease [Planctomycetota bacterium]|nr:MAG: ABC transporter permease [Planctomycetota bacterium]REJ89816.1 MAG: ABC transporter permease [Planctomycetota bacterium]REK21567.1 MAG: ABC transporter permease [Planctomycetota bacterium]REK39880.1 MAG: ABC transporter permease [Planctomycetota bacterium]